jgi:hypothetical protein
MVNDTHDKLAIVILRTITLDECHFWFKASYFLPRKCHFTKCHSQQSHGSCKMVNDTLVELAIVILTTVTVYDCLFLFKDSYFLQRKCHSIKCHSQQSHSSCKMVNDAHDKLTIVIFRTITLDKCHFICFKIHNVLCKDNVIHNKVMAAVKCLMTQL